MQTGAGMLAGDVFLNETHHTAIAVSSNTLVAAHDNYDGKTGDSSGREIDICLETIQPGMGFCLAVQ